MDLVCDFLFPSSWYTCELSQKKADHFGLNRLLRAILFPFLPLLLFHCVSVFCLSTCVVWPSAYLSVSLYLAFSFRPKLVVMLQHFFEYLWLTVNQRFYLLPYGWYKANCDSILIRIMSTKANRHRSNCINYKQTMDCCRFAISNSSQMQ